jgi:DNA-binding beta-propeller fold protein YncE
MVISPDGQSAFLLDEHNGYLSRIDLTTDAMSSRVHLDYAPKYETFLVDQNLLAVSLSLAQKVILLDPLDLAIKGTIFTGSGPEGLVVYDNNLLIAEYGDNSVAFYDLMSRRVKSRQMVGFGPRRLLLTGDQIYVSNYQDGSLSILLQDELGLIQEISGLKSPKELVYDQSYFRLYVTDEKAAALAVIDVNSNLLLSYIPLGAEPFGLALLQ